MMSFTTNSAATMAQKWLMLCLALLMTPLVAGKIAAQNETRRVVLYEQTYHLNAEKTEFVSLLPLIADPNDIPVTHVLLSAVHVVDEYDGIRLNDYPPEHEYFVNVWEEARQMREAGVTVMAMVGGAHPGSWDRLDTEGEVFEHYYGGLRDFVSNYSIMGLDLDVEQPMSLPGMIRLIDRLRDDFGDDFVISMAPVATALTESGVNLSGFSYFDIEALRGDDVDFYNAQFYNNWGDAGTVDDYYRILADFNATSKVVMGMLSNGANGVGFVPVTSDSKRVVTQLSSEVPEFGGVAAWEYYNSQPGGIDAPEQWSFEMASYMADGLANPTERRDPATLSLPERVMHTLRRRARKFYLAYLA